MNGWIRNLSVGLRILSIALLFGFCAASAMIMFIVLGMGHLSGSDFVYDNFWTVTVSFILFGFVIALLANVRTSD